MIFTCPDCRQRIDSSTQMRQCRPAGHDPCVTIDDGTTGKTVEARKPERRKDGFQSDFYLVGWGETEVPYSVRRNRKFK